MRNDLDANLSTGGEKRLGRTSQSDRRRWVLAGLIVSALGVGFLLLLELALWLFGVKSLSNRTENILLDVARPKAIKNVPDLGWVLSPGFDGVVEGVRYRINSLGFRGPEIRRTKPKGSFRVLCLGDLVTYGVMVHEERTYCSVLEKRLGRMLAPQTVEVINAGVPGYSSVQVSLHFSQDCLPLDPDLVTLCVGVNDAFTIPNLCDDDENLYVPWWRFIRKARKTLGHSRLFTLLDSGVIWLIKGRPTSVNDARSSQGMKPRVDLQSYYDNLLSIAQTCRRRGIPLLLFSFSLPDDYSRAMQRAAQNSKA